MSFLIIIKKQHVGHSPRLCVPCCQWSSSQCESTHLMTFTQISYRDADSKMPFSAFYSFCKERLSHIPPPLFFKSSFLFQGFFLFHVLQSILVINRFGLQLSQIWLLEPFYTGPQQFEFFFTFRRNKMSQAWSRALAGRTQPPGPRQQPLTAGPVGPEGGPRAAREQQGWWTSGGGLCLRSTPSPALTHGPASRR